jgi:hypothetical protein
MLTVARRFLLILIAFALVGGTTMQLARSTQYEAVLVTAGVPCDMTMPAPAAEKTKPMMPCKGMTPDCIKQMGCVESSALPSRLNSSDFATHYSPVIYWTASSRMDGLIRKPDPFPPRTA